MVVVDGDVPGTFEQAFDASVEPMPFGSVFEKGPTHLKCGDLSNACVGALKMVFERLEVAVFGRLCDIDTGVG
jgi:hypothetical protein